MKKTIKFIAIFVMLNILLTIHSHFFAFNTETLTTIDLTEDVTINNRFLTTAKKYSPNPDKCSIIKTKPVKSISTDEYLYTVCELFPSGYIILLNESAAVLEACYDDNVTSPIPMDSSTDYYYIGINTFAYKVEDHYVEYRTNSKINVEQLNELISTDSSLLNDHSFRSLTNDSLIASTSSQHITNYVDLNYFSNLNNHGNNTNGTCTVIAASILLGYYDYKMYDGYVADIHTVEGSSSSSRGTNEAFHQHLCNFVYGTNPQGAISITNAIPGLNSYLSSRNLPISFYSERVVDTSTQHIQDQIFSSITNQYPLIASTAQSYDNAPWNHSLVIYGYEYDTSSSMIQVINPPSYQINNLVFHAHMGWSSNSNNVIISPSWITTYGKITDCNDNHTSYNVIDSTDYHSGNYHYYVTITTCVSCGNTVQNTTSRICHACPEFN